MYHKVLNFIHSTPLRIFSYILVSHIYLLFVFCFFLLFRATPSAYESSQGRSLGGAVAAGLHHSHRNSGPELRLRPTQ